MGVRMISILGFPLHLYSKENIYSIIKKALSQKTKTAFLYTDFRLLNYNYRNRNPIDNRNILFYPDSTGVWIILKLFFPNVSSGFKKLVSTDIHSELLKIANENHSSLFLMGSTNNILNSFIERASIEYPGIKIFGSINGYNELNEYTISKINTFRPDILLIGMGVPKQELWIFKNLDNINANVILTVGAFFSFYSGHLKRAPKIFRKLSLEWSYRLIQEPSRLWKRYFLEYPTFAIHVIIEEIKKCELLLLHRI